MKENKDTLKERTPFKVPDGYFDNLADRIIENVEEEEKEEKVRILPVIKSFMWMAASFVFIFTLGRTIVPYFSNPSEKISQAVVESASSTAVNEESTFDFTDGFEPSVDDIIEYLSDEDIDGELLVAEL